MKTYFSIAALTALSLSVARSAPDAAQTEASGNFKPAPIHIVKVSGDVTAKTNGGTPKNLAKDDVIQQGTVILTGPDSSVSLAFANGATISVLPKSELVINEFQQVGTYDVQGELPNTGGPTAPPSSGKSFNQLGVEPSYSKTRVFLREGTMYVSVQKLRKKSYFYSASPVGVGEVLGTLWRQTTAVDENDNSAKVGFAMQRGRLRFRPLSSPTNPYKPFVINNYESYTITGKFANRSFLNSALEMFSNGFGADVEVSTMQMNLEQSFEALRENLVPPPVDANLVGEPLPPNLDTNIDTDPFFTGDQGVGTVGTLGNMGGGSGGGSGSNQASPTPTPLAPSS